jgi:hypothetical protein
MSRLENTPPTHLDPHLVNPALQLGIGCQELVSGLQFGP